MEQHKNDQLKMHTLFWAIGTAGLLIVIAGWGALSDFNTTWKVATAVYALLVILSRWFINYWYRNFTEAGAQEVGVKNPYRRMFFGSVNVLTIILLVIGIGGAFFMLFSDDGQNHAFEAMGLIVIVIWAVIFLRYFIWGVYHYNINYGLTDKDWQRIFEAREQKELGIAVSEDRLKAPKYNPYRSQTFGLPPGTVRGMIAFTLLFGAISMLIASMGMSGNVAQDSFYWDHFEFYKTAFLMMIAFYFGDRSLRYLQKRWPSAQQGDRIRQQQKKSDEPDDEIAEDNAEFDLEQVQSDNQGIGSRDAASPSSLKDILIDAESDRLVQEPVNRALDFEYVQVRDSTVQKNLSDEMLESVAKDYKIELATLKAIIDVESSGTGFLPDGRPKILFEGHVFWRVLKRRNQPVDKLRVGNEDILYPSWTRNFYLGGSREYKRFEKAKRIDPVAAIYATSWGLFQILGDNFAQGGYCHSRTKSKDDLDKLKDELTNLSDFDQILDKEMQINKAYERIDNNGRWDINPEDFEEKQGLTENNHLLDFISFIETKKVKYGGMTKSASLLSLILESNKQTPTDTTGNYNWEAFAYGYNGSGFKTNAYHLKLQKAYEKHSKS